MYTIKAGNLWGHIPVKNKLVTVLVPTNFGKVNFEIINPKDILVRTCYSNGWIKK